MLTIGATDELCAWKKPAMPHPRGGAAGLDLDEVAFYPCVAKKRRKLHE